MAPDRTLQTRSTWHHVLVYFGLVRTDAEERIAASPAAQRIEKSRRKLEILRVLLLGLLLLGNALLPDTTATLALGSATVIAMILVWRRSVVLRRRALRIADRDGRET